MKLHFINDWQYLVKPWAIGGKFANFTILQISYLNLHNETPQDLDINGFSIVILGLGVRVGKR